MMSRTPQANASAIGNVSRTDLKRSVFGHGIPFAMSSGTAEPVKTPLLYPSNECSNRICRQIILSGLIKLTLVQKYTNPYTRDAALPLNSIQHLPRVAT